MKEQNQTCAVVRSEDISRHMYSAALTGCLSSSSSSGSLSTLGTGGVSWRTRLVPVWGDALSAEPVSTAGGDWILQDVLTRSTAGRLLLLRNMTPPPLSVKTCPDKSNVTVTGRHHFCQGGFVSTLYVCVLVGWFVSGIIKTTEQITSKLGEGCVLWTRCSEDWCLWVSEIWCRSK